MRLYRQIQLKYTILYDMFKIINDQTFHIRSLPLNLLCSALLMCYDQCNLAHPIPNAVTRVGDSCDPDPWIPNGQAHFLQPTLSSTQPHSATHPRASPPGLRPLHGACLVGHLDVAVALLEEGAAVDAADNAGLCSLRNSFFAEDIEIKGTLRGNVSIWQKSWMRSAKSQRLRAGG